MTSRAARTALAITVVLRSYLSPSPPAWVQRVPTKLSQAPQVRCYQNPDQLQSRHLDPAHQQHLRARHLQTSGLSSKLIHQQHAATKTPAHPNAGTPPKSRPCQRTTPRSGRQHRVPRSETTLTMSPLPPPVALSVN